MNEIADLRDDDLVMVGGDHVKQLARWLDNDSRTDPLYVAALHLIEGIETALRKIDDD